MSMLEDAQKFVDDSVCDTSYDGYRDDLVQILVKWYTRGFDEGYKCRQKQEEEDDE